MSSSWKAENAPICHIVTPVGMMGYGFDTAPTEYHLAHLVPTGIPTAIILDAGSTDSGPHRLALGSTGCPRAAYVRDLTKLLDLVHRFRVPLIFASAGGGGTDEHVKAMENIITGICSREGNEDYNFKTISTFSNIEKSLVGQRLQDKQVTGCGPCVPPLTVTDIEESTSVVAQVGPEVFLDAMQATPDFDILIGGRAYDPAPYVAYAQFALKLQHPGLAEQTSKHRLGGFTHMGKIMECGGACSQPKSHGAIASVFADGVFDVRPLAFESRCTAQTVAAHALYENTRPDVLKGPGGVLELLGAAYEELPDQRTVRVRGSIFKSSREQGLPYSFKLEAGKLVGYRSLFMGSIKDYGLIEQIDTLLAAVKAYVKQQHIHLSDSWNLDFHVYGKGHTNGRGGPGELFIVAEALAPSQELASSIASKARVGLIHAPYPGQKATSGNVGFGIGGLMEIEAGPCAEFSIYHLLELKLGEERLVLDNTPEIEGSLQLRRTVQTFGYGRPTNNDLDFQRGIARLRDTLPQPTISSQPQATGEASRTCLPTNLSDLCGVFRSKNAGPFEITVDAIFLTPQIYEAVKKSNILTPDTVARALGVSRKDIIWMGFYDPAKAFKVTIPRIRSGIKKAAGGFMENDVHGSQEHVGLATLKLPQDLEDLVSLDSAASKAVAKTACEWTTVLGVVAAVGSLGVAALLKRLVSGK